MFRVQWLGLALKAKLDGHGKQVPFAMMGTLNTLAFETRAEWGKILQQNIDRPTPFVRNSVLYSKATKTNLAGASIYIRDTGSGTPPVKVLRALEFGGARHQKSFERKLSRMPGAGKFYVPGAGADLDQYGNIRRGVLTKILSQLQVATGTVEGMAGHSQNESAERRARRLKRERSKGGGGNYFMLSRDRGSLKAGVVYERRSSRSVRGSETRSILFPIAQPSYRPRLKVIDAAQRFIARRLPVLFRQKLREALSTAR